METTSRTCRWVCRRLPLLVGGDLAGPERRRVERHLIGCQDCRSHQTAAGQSLAILHEVAALGPLGAGLDAVGTSPSLWPALARQIRESKHRPTLGDWVRSRGGSSLVVRIGAGLAASVLLASGWFWSASRAESEPTPVATVAPSPAAAPATVPPLAPAETDLSLAPLMADNARFRRFYEEYEGLTRRLNRHRSALPNDDSGQVMPPLKSGANPFDTPRSLRLDYDLDWGTLSGPVADTQRAY